MRSVEPPSFNPMVLTVLTVLTFAIHTQNRYGGNSQPNFFPVRNGFIQFGVTTQNDAVIALTTNTSLSNPKYEIILGGWNNQKSILRRDGQTPNRAEAYTPSLLSGSQERMFWIKCMDGLIEVGQEGQYHPFMVYKDPYPFPIYYFGISSGHGGTGVWKIPNGDVPPTIAPVPAFPALPVSFQPVSFQPVSFQPVPIPPVPVTPVPVPSAPVYVSTSPSVQWISSSGSIPPGAFVGGKDHDCNLYIGQAHHSRDLIPGKVQPNHKKCYVPWGGKEHAKGQFKVLCGSDLQWVSGTGKNIPMGAIPGGQTEDGETLYIGRVHHKGTVTVGKVHPSHGTCYIPYGGSEIGFSNYEILVPKPRMYAPY